jgi:transposase
MNGGLRFHPAVPEISSPVFYIDNVEEDGRGQPPDTRRAARQAQAKPQLDALKARMQAIRAKLSAKSTLAVAITDALKRWPALTRYCEDGRLEIDNLIAERALRGVAILRRTKQNGVEPFACISGVMQKIAGGWPNSRIGELMPSAWRPVAQQKAA